MHRASQVSYVTIDNTQAAQNVVSHLINQGYKRIGHITGMMENIDGADRLTGYKNALQQARIPYDETLVVEGHFTRMSGYLGMKMLLERGVRAVFAASDLMADGATQAIHEAGLRVPDDIALVGFDDLPYASQMSPQLTTVRQPIQQKGAYAVNILLDMIEGVAESAQHVLLPTQLVIRESCGAVKTIA
jgi:LacI family transcriptional regulator